MRPAFPSASWGVGKILKILKRNTEPEFVYFLGQNNISIFRFDSEEELLKDIENA